jgi:hypothetical protein
MAPALVLVRGYVLQVLAVPFWTLQRRHHPHDADLGAGAGC